MLLRNSNLTMGQVPGPKRTDGCEHRLPYQARRLLRKTLCSHWSVGLPGSTVGPEQAQRGLGRALPAFGPGAGEH